MQKELFTRKLIEWYNFHKRELPWRNTNDPYKIWLSEIILQQTRIAQGLPYYHKFIEKYPDLQHFSEASENEILWLWQGLGYYSRARNMLFCAKTLQHDHGGHFPESFEELRRLKGIGDYTAAAIASFAFGKKVAVLDGNVFRVLARVFGISKDISQPAVKKYFFQLASQIIPDVRPDIYNQAIMEFGALQCVPKQPNCRNCILKNDCIAYNNSLQDVLPVKTKRLKIRSRYFYYLVISNEKGFYMKKRHPGDIWTGLYDFLLIETDEMKDQETINDLFQEKFGFRFFSKSISSEYRHILTHQKIIAQFIKVDIGAECLKTLINQTNIQLYTPTEIDQMPKPNLIYNFLNQSDF